MDGKHTTTAKLQKGTDWISCSCGSQVFSIAHVEFQDYEDGVVAQCQECEQILQVWKD